MAAFNSYASHYHRVCPINSHKTTIKHFKTTIFHIVMLNYHRDPQGIRFYPQYTPSFPRFTGVSLVLLSTALTQQGSPTGSAAELHLWDRRSRGGRCLGWGKWRGLTRGKSWLIRELIPTNGS